MAHGVVVKGFVNGHIVFTETVEADATAAGAIAERQIADLLKYVGPGDLCLLELHWLADDTYSRVGTDTRRMVNPVLLDPRKKIFVERAPDK